jgi:hypothetical protein
MFESLKNKGQMAQGPVQLLVFAVIGIIAILIYGQIDQTVVTTTIPAAGQAARANFSANTYAGYQTLSVGPTVLAAVVVLGIVGMLLYMGRK